MNNKIITLSHGSGGIETYKLIDEMFYRNFNNDELLQQGDSTVLNEIKGKIATTIDGFVVDPIFFKGGDIGKLSLCGTINDLAVNGACPLYITCSFIIEEGFEFKSLEKIVQSMAKTAKESNVKIVAGDTKVVEKVKGHKVYISTCGIGYFKEQKKILNVNNIKSGDKIILSGTIGEHGMCIMNERENLNIDSEIKSDCAPLNSLCEIILNTSNNVRIMRDPTRGGIANTLNELSRSSLKSMMIYEEFIPINNDVRSFFELLGMSPLYIANEGKLLCIVDEVDAENVLSAMKNHPLGKDAAIIGEVIKENKGAVYIKGLLGSTKVLQMSQGELLPRIC
ncbi:hydrogenase expression/formation protein HypE [Clostridium botulinum]|nr:hydrogenase expression/formation protein HypE [Clostridium botulinum]NFP30769.1 hydrogenase expression/formation protein HypE [Clostridium botulinum]